VNVISGYVIAFPEVAVLQLLAVSVSVRVAVGLRLLNTLRPRRLDESHGFTASESVSHTHF